MLERTTRTLLAAALVSAATGCVESALKPDDPVKVTGKALNDDQTPISNVELVLGRSESSTCAFATSNFAPVKTGQDGSWTWSGLGKDTQNGSVARCFRASLPSSADGAFAWHDFLVQLTEVKVPDLRRWAGQPAAAQTTTGAQVTFAAPAITGATVGRVELRRSNSAQLWWMMQTPTSPVALSDEVLEDAADLQAQLFATGETKDSGTTFKSSWGSARTAVTGHGKVPVSRGAACTFIDNQPCRLTDGEPLPVTATSDSAAPLEPKVTLASAKLLKKAVLRGVVVSGTAKSLVLEGSADGTTFQKLAEVTEGAALVNGFHELTLTSSAPVSVIRLRALDQASQPARFSGAAEISLFE